MYVSISNQAYVFIYSILVGIITAIIYDVFRLSRKTIRTANLVVYVEDILYWIIAAIVILLMIYRVNDGEIRGYVLLGIILGSSTYSLFLSKYFMKIFMAIINLLTKLLRMVLLPFRFLIRVLMVPVKIIILLVKKIIKIVNKIYVPLRNNMVLKIKILKNIRKCL